MIRLNLGAGGTQIEGFTPIDRKLGGEVYPLAYEDDSVDEIRASHVLEHFGHRETLKVLREWARVLKPGGVMRVAVPDYDWNHRAYATDLASSLPLEQYIMGGQVDDDDWHGTIFNRQKLEMLMRASGLRCITTWESEIKDCAALPVSLNLAGRKVGVTSEDMKRDVIFCMTRPRFCSSTAGDCIEQLRIDTRMRAIKSGGVFWGQGLEQTIQHALEEEDCKYILTCDYDTIFTTEDVRELYAIMETHPHINALVPVQMRRDSVYALLTVADDKGNAVERLDAEKINQATMPIRSGHFGLTLIRADLFRKIGKPWFVAQPGPNAADPWGEGRVDADVSFWLRAEGIYMANSVVVGHIQEVITWPSKQLQPLHQYVPEWTKAGKPAGVLA